MKKNRLVTVDGKQVQLRNDIQFLVDTGKLTNDTDGVFFQRQLEYIQASSYDVLYPHLKARDIFGLNTEGGHGINTITYRSYDKRGEAKIISGYATDLPRVDIDGKEYTINVRTLGDSYGYSIQELAASQLTGLPLDAQKAAAARLVYEELVNRISFFGNADSRINGLFGGTPGDPWSTISNTIVAGAAATGNSTVWGETKTPDEVIKDLTDAVSSMVEDTLQIHLPNKILMSVEKYNYMMNTPRSQVADTSIMEWFVGKNQYINSVDKIIPVNELDGIFGTTPGEFTGDKNGFVVMEANDMNFRLREPFPFTHLPVQYKGLEFEINCYGRFAGLEIIRPAAIAFYYGI